MARVRFLGGAVVTFFLPVPYCSLRWFVSPYFFSSGVGCVEILLVCVMWPGCDGSVRPPFGDGTVLLSLDLDLDLDLELASSGLEPK
jgi:hypothetical protein